MVAHTFNYLITMSKLSQALGVLVGITFITGAPDLPLVIHVINEVT